MSRAQPQAGRSFHPVRKGISCCLPLANSWGDGNFRNRKAINRSNWRSGAYSGLPFFMSAGALVPTLGGSRPTRGTRVLCQLIYLVDILSRYQSRRAKAAVLDDDEINQILESMKQSGVRGQLRMVFLDLLGYAEDLNTGLTKALTPSQIKGAQKTITAALLKIFESG